MFRRAVACAVLGGTTVLALAGPAAGGGQGEEIAFSYSPQSGPAGTVITVSGTGCDTEVDTKVQVVLSAQGINGTVIASAFSATIPAGSGGNWTVMVTVPLGTSPGTYDLQAFCGIAGEGVFPASVPQPNGTVGFVSYTPGQFVVPASPATTTTTTTTPPAASTEVAPSPAPAPPAPMVAATPRTAG